MAAKKTPGLLQQSRAREMDQGRSDSILSPPGARVKCWTQKFLEKHGLKRKELLEIISRKYPAFDKTLLSKCENGKYGVDLSSPLKRYLNDEMKKKENR